MFASNLVHVKIFLPTAAGGVVYEVPISCALETVVGIVNLSSIYVLR